LAWLAGGDRDQCVAQDMARQDAAPAQALGTGQTDVVGVEVEAKLARSAAIAPPPPAGFAGWAATAGGGAP